MIKHKLYEIMANNHCSIKEVLKILDHGAKGIVLITDDEKKLLGTITDGDIRRAILKDISIDENIGQIIHLNPTYARQGASKEELKDLFIKKAVKQIPIVDGENRIVDLISINDILLPLGKENPVVVMAGGLGSRLMELTNEIPKPMLRVGKDPLLQHIIRNFREFGYNKIILSVNYKSEIIENYFQDGYAYGVKIEYVKEKDKLGTAGGIRLAENFINNPFFVINGDIFTNFNPESMMNFHMDNQFDITVGIKKHNIQIPYGVIEIGNYLIKAIKEKPIIENYINTGIYCLNPNLIGYIPRNQYFEITDLINICLEKGLKVGAYEIHEYWMDIGQIEDYNKVNNDYETLFRREACATEE